MKKPLNGKRCAALILLLSGAFAICTVWPRKLPPVPLTIVGQRVILEISSPLDHPIHVVAMSMDGRHVLFGRTIAPGESSYELLLLNVATGHLLQLPLSPPILLGKAAFTSGGHYFYAMESPNGSYVEKDRPRLILYDIRKGKLRTLKGGWVVGDDHEEDVLVSDFNSDDLDVIPVGEGPIERYGVHGCLIEGSRKDRALELEGNFLSVVDLVRGKTLKKLALRGELVVLRPDTAFHFTTDDSFLYYSYDHPERNTFAICRNYAAKVLPFVAPSHEPEFDMISCSGFWESATNRETSLNGFVFRNQWPTNSSAWGWDVEGTLCVQDFASGREFVFPGTTDLHQQEAIGRYVLAEVSNSDYLNKYILIEVALPRERK